MRLAKMKGWLFLFFKTDWIINILAIPLIVFDSESYGNINLKIYFIVFLSLVLIHAYKFRIGLSFKEQ